MDSSTSQTFEEIKRALLSAIGDTRECRKCGHLFVPTDLTQRECIDALKKLNEMDDG